MGDGIPASLAHTFANTEPVCMHGILIRSVTTQVNIVSDLHLYWIAQRYTENAGSACLTPLYTPYFLFFFLNNNLGQQPLGPKIINILSTITKSARTFPISGMHNRPANFRLSQTVKS